MESTGLTSSRQVVDGMTMYGTEPIVGTTEEAKIWCNTNDKVGLSMAIITWICLLYGAFVVCYVSLVVHTFYFVHAICYCAVSFLALWAHVKTMITDPGTLPRNAQPLPNPDGGRSVPGNMCGRCDAYKPPRSHHCRTCGRCVVRMDHHCPWMNNCIGATNLKHFFLFLLYTLTACVYCLSLILYHFLICELEADVCDDYTGAEANMIRVCLVLAFAGAMFVVSMMSSQINGVVTGVGTVDRMQRRRKERVRMDPSVFKRVDWQDVFGTGPRLAWLLPIDFEFRDKPRALLYTVPPAGRPARKPGSRAGARGRNVGTAASGSASTSLGYHSKQGAADRDVEE